MKIVMVGHGAFAQLNQQSFIATILSMTDGRQRCSGYFCFGFECAVLWREAKIRSAGLGPAGACDRQKYTAK